MKILFSGLVLATVLFGCNGSEDKIIDNNTHPTTNYSPLISDFRIVGTSATSNKITPINAQLNKGKFTLSWLTSLKITTNYQVMLYLSKDENLNMNDGDYLFASKNCNVSEDKIASNCDGRFRNREISSYFSTDLKILSDTGPSSFDQITTDVSTWITSLPEIAFIILELCTTGTPIKCESKSQAVIFE